jgi:hypothetical protein
LREEEREGSKMIRGKERRGGEEKVGGRKWEGERWREKGEGRI